MNRKILFVILHIPALGTYNTQGLSQDHRCTKNLIHILIHLGHSNHMVTRN